MPGLLSTFSDPEQMGLLGVAAGLLSAGGPSRLPVALGQAAGQGVMQGVQAARETQSYNMQQQMQSEQMKALELNNALLSGRAAFFLGTGVPGAPAAANVNPMVPGLPTSSVMAGGGSTVPSQASSRFPTLPGFENNPRMNDAAWLGYLNPGAVSGYVSANAPKTLRPGGGIVEIGPDGKPVLSFQLPSLEKGMTIDPAGNVGLADGYTKTAAALNSIPNPSAPMVQVPVSNQRTLSLTQPEYLQYQRSGVLPGRYAALASELPGARFAGSGAVPASPFLVSGGASTDSAGVVGATQSQGEQIQQQGDTAFAKALSSEMAKSYGDILQAGLAAPKSVIQYQRLGYLLNQVQTGKFRGTTLQIKSAAKSAGIDLGALGISDDVAPGQAAAALSNQLALELRNPAGGAGMPGSLSNSDRSFLTQMVPSIENDPNAISLMIDYRTRLAKRDEEIAKLARDYKRTNGRFDDGFYDELQKWSDTHPMFTKDDVARATGQQPAYTQQDLEFTAKKYGMTVDDVKRRLGVR